jgi:hypothetical protein
MQLWQGVWYLCFLAIGKNCGRCDKNTFAGLALSAAMLRKPEAMNKQHFDVVPGDLRRESAACTRSNDGKRS